jgi:hypothetical protein
LRAAQPEQLLEVGSSVASRNSNFIRIQSGVVIVAAQSWDAQAVQQTVSVALRPGLTTGQMGLGWLEHSIGSGSYFALDSSLQLCIAVRGNRLYFANSAPLLEQMLALPPATSPAPQSGITYTAVLRHSAGEQANFEALFSRLDHAASAASAQSANQAPQFFSGNVESLSAMFQNVERETVTERDQGTKVLQTVSYDWKH